MNTQTIRPFHLAFPVDDLEARPPVLHKSAGVQRGAFLLMIGLISISMGIRLLRILPLTKLARRNPTRLMVIVCPVGILVWSWGWTNGMRPQSA